MNKKRKFSKLKKFFSVITLVIILGYLIPENTKIPVKGAKHGDWHPKSFWFEPWGTSGTHKGIDIFAGKGTKLLSSTSGIVLYTGTISKGGNVIVVLGPKWKLHYYAHLESIDTESFSLVKSGEIIGAVGDSGNAKGKPPHLHYSILSLLPHFWKATAETQGWKKMFFLDPVKNML